MKKEKIIRILGSMILVVFSFLAWVYTELCNIFFGALFFLILGIFSGIYLITTKVEKMKFKRKSHSQGFYCIT